MNNENTMRYTMLKGFEENIHNLFNKYYKSKISLDVLISNFNHMMKIHDFSRVDIKNHGNNENSIKFIEYGKNVSLTFPNWYFNSEGHGCKLEWKNEYSLFVFKCIGKGKLKIILRGMDFRDVDNSRVPIFLNYHEMLINDNLIFKENNLVWHDKPYTYEKNCENGEVIIVTLKFKTLFDYYPQLKMQINESNIDSTYNKINHYISNEKVLL